MEQRYKADSIKYLGVTVDSKENWNAHVNSTVAKANLNLGFVRRDILTLRQNGLNQQRSNNWYVLF